MGLQHRRVYCHRLQAVELKIGMVSERRTKNIINQAVD